MKNVGLVFVSSLLSAILAIFIYRVFDEPKEIIVRESGEAQYTSYTDALLSGQAQRRFLSASPTDFTAPAEIVTPAVVNITARFSSKFDFWMNTNNNSSTGSGVIISPDGYVVTNKHVINEADKIELTLDDRREFEAVLIGSDPSTDLALLKIEDKDLPYLQFGNSDSLRVGEWVLAVGNPLNLQSTVTAGIVSAKGRNIDILDDQYRIESFIQTDAIVNPGNSGGALVNTNGELIGINTAIMTRSGYYEGYSFAVPSNLVQKVIRDLRDFGVVQRGILGINIGDVDSQLAKQLGLASIDGIHIQEARPGSGAALAGLQRDDVIISVNGVTVTKVPELQEQIGQFRPGDIVNLGYIRKGKEYTAKVTLKDKERDQEARSEQTRSVEEEILIQAGFELRELNLDEKLRLSKNGVKVISIYKHSVIERANMDPGFIILRINDEQVKTVQEVVDALERASSEIVLEGIYEQHEGEYLYKFFKEDLELNLQDSW